MGERVFVQGQRQDRHRLSLACPKGTSPASSSSRNGGAWSDTSRTSPIDSRRRASSLRARSRTTRRKTTSPDQAGKLMMSLRIDEAAKIGRRQRSPAGAAGITWVQSRHGRVLHGRCAPSSAASQNPEVGACVVFYGGHPNVKPDLSTLQAPVGIWAEKDGVVHAEVVGELDSSPPLPASATKPPQLPAGAARVLHVLSRGLRCCGVSRCVGEDTRVFRERNSKGNSLSGCLRTSRTVSALHLPHSAQVLLVEDDHSAPELLAKALRMTGSPTSGPPRMGSRRPPHGSLRTGCGRRRPGAASRERIRAARRAACGRAHASHSGDCHLRQRERTPSRRD